MYLANPRDRERFYLRLLLLHVTEAYSFADIRSFENIICLTYFEAIYARQLIVMINKINV